uniref:Uncharacterized protein n=1 Tax=Salix viminalis TaxID=40686 RepID=A0A6N2M7K4_SALVM
MVSLLQTKIYPPIVSYRGKDSDGGSVLNLLSAALLLSLFSLLLLFLLLFFLLPLPPKSSSPLLLLPFTLTLTLVLRILLSANSLTNRSNWTNPITVSTRPHLPSIVEHIQIRTLWLQIIQVRPLLLQVTGRIPPFIEQIQVRPFRLLIINSVPSIVE